MKNVNFFLKKWMRLRVTLHVFFMLITANVFSQTTLHQGDMSIIAINSNGTPGFAFVPWIPLAVGTEIRFTDNGFGNGLSTALNNILWQEQVAIWTATVAVPAGTVVKVMGEVASTGTADVVNSSGLFNPTTISLNTSFGDQLFAYQGDDVPGGILAPILGSLFTFSNTILYGVGYQSNNGPLSWLTSGLVDSYTSYLPSDLAPLNNLFLGAHSQGGQYTGVRVGLSVADFRAAIADPANWTSVTGSGILGIDLTIFLFASPPSITANPSGSTICAGSNTTFSATAANTNSYQWQVNTGSGFANLSNGGVYSGATTATLSITGATAAMNGYQYRLVATGTLAPTATSTAATLTVNSAPSVTSAITAAVTCSGGNASFAVGAASTTGYNWQVNTGSGFANITNGGVYSGQGTGTLSITGTTASMNGYTYQVVLSGACSPTTLSGPVALTVNSAPVITAGPSSQGICPGSNTSFSVTATGATAYQWQVDQGTGYTNLIDNGFYSGSTSSTLSVSGVTNAFNGFTYRAVASSSCSPAATSSAATLTINSAPSITSAISASTICAGANTSFTVGASNATGYNWQVNTGSGFTDIANGGVYSGQGTSTLSITGATAGMSGYTYQVVASGICSPTALSGPVALTVNSAPSVTSAISASTICAGANTSFAVSASNTTGYNWQVNTGSGFADITNGGVYSGQGTATLSLTAATASMNGYTYQVVASGICSPTALSGPVSLTVNSAPQITSSPSSQAICPGSGTTFSVTASNATGYQWQVDQGTGYTNLIDNAFYSGSNSGTLSVSGVTAAFNGFVYRAVASGICSPAATSSTATLSINVAPSVTMAIAGSTICDGGNTSFTVAGANTTGYNWQVNTGSGFADITNGGVYSGQGTATLSLTGATASMNGYTYQAVLSGVCSPNAVSGPVSLTVNAAPAISAAPSNTSVCDGANTSFTASATAATGYQWQVDQGSGYANVANGGMYSGAATATLSITGATLAMNGYQYRVVASGICSPAANSAGASLSVLANVTYYADADGDGYGNPAVTATSCSGTPPTGYVSNNTDSDDNNSAVNPGATEICYDGIDNNSNGVIDEGCTPLTTISSVYCGQTYEYLNTEYIAADPVPNADQYEFRITNGAFSATATDNLVAGKVRIIQFTGYEYNKTYQLSVRARVNGVWGIFGSACSITTTAFPHSEIQASQCGATLAEMSTVIFTSTVNGATKYRFRVANGSSVQILDRTVRTFSMNMLTSYAFGITYSVSVAVEFNGVFQPYSTACNITTPPVTQTKVISSQCGSTLPAVNKLIYADIVANATKYRFRVTNGSNVQSIDRTTNSFYLIQLASYAYATSYSIDISIELNGAWQTYGPVCIVTTPVAGSVLTSLETDYCGVTLNVNSQNLIATPVTSATQYQFLVENTALGYSQSVTRTTYNFNLSMLTGILNSTTYTVRIRSFVNSVWSAYGPSCSVTTTGSGMRPMGDDGNDATLSKTPVAFEALVFPNPFESKFGISVSTAGSEAVNIVVYDVTGKMIESRKVAAEEISSVRMGADYAAGIYQVHVIQGSDTQLLKVVKQ